MRVYDILNTLTEADEMAELDVPTIKALEKKIKDGARDLDQMWPNALALVHKAYEVLNVERPTPKMVSAWSQYEDLIALAVRELAKARGDDASWRATDVTTPDD